MPVRKRNLRILCVLKEMASQYFPYTSASIPYKTLKKILFEYQMVRGKNFFSPFTVATSSAGGICTTLRHLSFWIGSSLKLSSCLTALLLENTVTFLLCDSTGQRWDSRFREEFYESSMYKSSSGFIQIFFCITYSPQSLCPVIQQQELNWKFAIW